MAIHPLAGKTVPQEMLIDSAQIAQAYYENLPDVEDPGQMVSFGTSGHRGNALISSFNEAHIIAISQAVCEYRKQQGISGPLYMGMDTHVLSGPAHQTAIEVLAANDVKLFIHQNGNFTPTPVISHAILTHNATISPESGYRADGIVITPSHNPPADGGFKYNPPHGGPADTAVTDWIQNRANELLKDSLNGVKRVDAAKAIAENKVRQIDMITPYVRDLAELIDFEAIQKAGLKLGADPLGGASLAYWEPIAELYGLDIEVVNKVHDPTFSFMPLDKDGQVRMDCSSPYAMAGLLEHKDRFDIAFGNDPDADRHGIVTPEGLMNPNHYLATAIWYLFQHRPLWPDDSNIGKTLVSSSIIDRVAHALGREINEVPVGFKWFVPCLLNGDCAFAGEESAGASFLRKDGKVWSTDKDGIIMNLLAVEITAVLGQNPAQVYAELTQKFGEPCYERMDAAATPTQKQVLGSLDPNLITAKTLAGDKITAVHVRAPGNKAKIGGIKVITAEGWFAARPSGTEDIYKIYAESFRGKEHLKAIQTEAQILVNTAFAIAGV